MKLGVLLIVSAMIGALFLLGPRWVRDPPTDPVAVATRPDALGESGPNREAAGLCSRHELAATITGLQERYDEYGEAIIKVNDELPSLSRMVLDIKRICTERTTKLVGSLLTRVEALPIAADYRFAETLAACVNRLYWEIDEELEEATSVISTKRLGGEKDELNNMRHRILNIEFGLQSGINKRARLVEELGEFQRVIEAACQ